MILQQVTQGQEAAIFPLLEERAAEANLGARLDLDFVKMMISQNLMLGAAEIFTDDIAKPACLLIMTYGRLSILTEECAIISVIHVAKSVREASPSEALSLGKIMLNLAELQARNKKCHSLRGTSLVWRGGMDISSFFQSGGFELQSHEFTKLLTPQ